MFQKLLERLSRELSGQRIPYMVIGGQAVLLYGEPRLTRDIDITLGLEERGFERILAVAGRLKLRPLVGRPGKFVRETMVLPVLDRKSGIRVDFIFSNSAYEKEALGRVKKIRMGRSRVCFASLEDVIIHKMVAGRPRDLEDVKGILFKNPGCNSRYIQKWLRSFGESLNQRLLENYLRLKREVCVRVHDRY